MRPVLLHWRGFKVASYPALLYLGMLAGLIASNLAAHAIGLDAFRVYVATLILIVPALLGARWLYIASHWQLYRQYSLQMLKRGAGGATLYGGLGLALLCSLPVLAALQLPLGAFWDVSVFAMLVLMIFGRIGCVLDGCCAGRPARSWIALRLPDGSGLWTERIPTQYLEAAWGAILLAAASVLWRRMPFPGALFLTVAAGYALGRLALESTRAQVHGARRFTLHHAISVLIVIASISLLAGRWPKPQGPKRQGPTQREVVRWRTVSPAALMS